MKAGLGLSLGQNFRIHFLEKSTNLAGAGGGVGTIFLYNDILKPFGRG